MVAVCFLIATPKIVAAPRLEQVRRIDLQKPAGGIAQVVVNSSGMLVVRDANYRQEASQAIELFDSSGRFLRKIGEFGKGPGEYFRLFQVRLDSKGYIWAADRAKILKFDGNGKLLGEILIQNPGYSANALAIDEPRGVFYLAGCMPRRVYLNLGCDLIHRYSFADNRYIRSYLGTDPEAMQKNLLPFESYMLDVDEAGRIYAADAPLFKIFRVDPNTAQTEALIVKSRVATAPHALPEIIEPAASTAAFENSYFLDNVIATNAWVAVSIRKPRDAGFVLEILAPDGRQIVTDGECPGRLVGKTADGHLVFAAKGPSGFALLECALADADAVGRKGGR